ncbi:hypothetical protein LJR220_004210 [Bradyrhizobium sp. LjRoot220]|uniref:hypothetical protein n=1 Tax=Bradyrhizobium sp. LjRoot220 TaxID=3342284 RepID=UPI003ECCCDD4
MRVDRIWEFLQRLSPLTRSHLLTELERLELCGIDMPGSADLQAKLRAELRPDGPNETPTPSKYFYAPLEPLFVAGAPEHANTGRIARSSLVPIWEWINRDLLPIMARDYEDKMKGLIASNKPRDAQQAASIFQTKVAKSLEGNLASAEGAERARAKLATYTASPSVYSDLIKLMGALRAREALAGFAKALPDKIAKFDDAQVDKITAQLNTFRKKDPDAVPFALALVSGRLKTPRELIRLATKPARSRRAVDVAATPYAISVSMVLDQIDDKRIALRVALKKNRVVDARDILADIDNTEAAVQAAIRELAASDWGARLRDIRSAIVADVEIEVSRFPDEVGHILQLRGARGNGLLSGLAWKGRDAISDGAAFCKRLIGQG